MIATYSSRPSRRLRLASRLAVLLLTLLLVAPHSGCVGLTVQIANMLGLNMVPAEYAGLKGRHVAVVCRLPENGYDPVTDGDLLTSDLEQYLGAHVKKITFVPRAEVENWLDAHAERQIDYARMGQALEAEKLLLVDFGSFSYGENATFYQGRADYNITVFDMETGEREYESTEPDMLFPTASAYNLGDMSKDRFRRAFVSWIARDVGQRFHMNDFPKRFSKEPSLD